MLWISQDDLTNQYLAVGIFTENVLLNHLIRIQIHNSFTLFCLLLNH